MLEKTRTTLILEKVVIKNIKQVALTKEVTQTKLIMTTCNKINK